MLAVRAAESQGVGKRRAALGEPSFGPFFISRGRESSWRASTASDQGETGEYDQARAIHRLRGEYNVLAGIDLIAQVLDARKLRVIAEPVTRCDRLDADILNELRRTSSLYNWRDVTELVNDKPFPSMNEIDCVTVIIVSSLLLAPRSVGPTA